MLIAFSHLSSFRPTVFISVPRVLNRVYDRVSMLSSYSSFIWLTYAEIHCILVTSLFLASISLDGICDTCSEIPVAPACFMKFSWFVFVCHEAGTKFMQFSTSHRGYCPCKLSQLQHIFMPLPVRQFLYCPCLHVSYTFARRRLALASVHVPTVRLLLCVDLYVLIVVILGHKTGFIQCD